MVAGTRRWRLSADLIALLLRADYSNGPQHRAFERYLADGIDRLGLTATNTSGGLSSAAWSHTAPPDEA